jgi:hypothetical protein
MGRRRFLLTTLAAAVAAPLSAQAQRPTRMHRIAYISAVGPEYSRFSRFQEGLRS